MADGCHAMSSRKRALSGYGEQLLAAFESEAIQHDAEMPIGTRSTIKNWGL